MTLYLHLLQVKLLSVALAGLAQQYLFAFERAPR